MNLKPSGSEPDALPIAPVPNMDTTADMTCSSSALLILAINQFQRLSLPWDLGVLTYELSRDIKNFLLKNNFGGL